MIAEQTNIPLPARTIASLELVKSAGPGLAQIHPFRERFFTSAVTYVFCYGCVIGFLQFLYRTETVSVQIKDLYSTALYLLFLVGGMRVVDRLTRNRAMLVLVNVAVFQAWKYFFYGNFRIDDYRVHLYTFVLASWLLAWWIWAETEMMEKFGLKRTRLPVDFVAAAALSSVILIYVLVFIKAYEFMLNFNPWEIVSCASDMLPQNLMICGFFFAVWNKLQEAGVSRLGIILIFSLMINLLQAPAFVALLVTEAIGPVPFAAGLLGNTLVFALVMSITYKNFRSSFPAAFLLTAFSAILILVGVL